MGALLELSVLEGPRSVRTPYYPGTDPNAPGGRLLLVAPNIVPPSNARSSMCRTCRASGSGSACTKKEFGRTVRGSGCVVVPQRPDALRDRRLGDWFPAMVAQMLRTRSGAVERGRGKPRGVDHRLVERRRRNGRWRHRRDVAARGSRRCHDGQRWSRGHSHRRDHPVPSSHGTPRRARASDKIIRKLLRIGRQDAAIPRRREFLPAELGMSASNKVSSCSGASNRVRDHQPEALADSHAP